MSNPSVDLGRHHLRRLRDIYRSSGWPCHDMLEIELLASGLVERVRGNQGHETLRITEAGVVRLAETFASNKAARSAHESLVEKVAIAMARSGRLAWRGLSLRAQVKRPEAGRPDAVFEWVVACPDVFSIRNTTVEAYLEPIVHEIKVSRADLLGDLQRPTKRAAYLGLGGECWYVLGLDCAGKPIAKPEEIPLECGVLLCEGEQLVVGRPAPRKAMQQMPFHVWMALARATPAVVVTNDGQQLL